MMAPGEIFDLVGVPGLERRGRGMEPEPESVDPSSVPLSIRD